VKAEGNRQALTVGSVLQETYRIVRRIGRGGMGEVYEATHARLSGRYAIKVLLGEIGSSEEVLARFRREAEVTSSLRHPNIVQVIDFNRTLQGDPYLVMEFLEGRELSAELEAEPRQPLARVAEILRQTVSGLTAAHNRGIVHRDLKPENLFLADVEGEEQRLVKILDFGISKVKEATTRLTRESAIMGTAHYMAPEQALGEVDRIDVRSDQFSLACIAYEMLSGREPFWGDSLPAVIYQVVHKDPAPLESVNPEVPPAVAEVIRRAMAKDPAARFPTVREFHAAFVAAAGAREAPRAPAAVAQPAPRPTAPTELAIPVARTARIEPTTFSSTIGETASGRTGARSRLLGFTAGVVVLGVVAVVLLTRGRTHPVPPPAAAAVVVPAPAPPPAPPPPPVEARPAAPPVVTVRVEGVPAEAQVTLDGEPARLPLQLAREQRSHMLRIAAPGFEPVEQAVSASADATITVSPKKAARGKRRSPAAGTAPAGGQLLLDL
jgi:serine/threonine-protein kinase